MTNNSWNSTIPVEETKGGTNQSTYTTGDILYASASNTLSKLAVGTNGQILTLASGVPSWATQSFITGANPVTDNALARWDGTSADALQNSTVIVSDNGEMTNASQSAFLAYLPSNASNVTGDSTSFFLGDTDVSPSLTSLYDVGSDFTLGASGGAYFTAPVSGRYSMAFTIYLNGITASHTDVLLAFYFTLVGGGYWRCGQLNLASCRTSGNEYSYSNHMLCTIDAGDSILFNCVVRNGTKVIGVSSGIALLRTYVSGALIC